jgi:hypothetical protein
MYSAYKRDFSPGAEIFGLVILCVPFLLLITPSNLQLRTDWALVREMAIFIVFNVGLFLFIQRLTVPAWQFFSAKNVVFMAVIVIVLSDALQMIPEMEWIRTTTAIRVEAYIALFLCAVQLGYLFPTPIGLRDIVGRFKDPGHPEIYFKLILLAFGIGMLPYLYYSGWSLTQIINDLIGPRFEESWARGTFGDYSVVFRSLSLLLRATPLLAAMYLRRMGESIRFSKLLLLLSLVLFVLSIEFLQGDRRTFVFLALSPFLFFYLTEKEPARRTRIIIVLMLIALAIVALTELQLRVRSIGLAEAWRRRLVTVRADRLYVDRNFVHFGIITELVPYYHDYIYFDELLYLLTLPIPRFLWPGKPIGFGWTYVTWIGHTTGSVSMSALGELYASFGIAAILLGGLAFGIMSRTLDRLLPFAKDSAISAAIFTMGSLILFIGIRSLREIIIFGYSLVAFVLLIYLGKRLSGQGSRPGVSVSGMV